MLNMLLLASETACRVLELRRLRDGAGELRPALLVATAAGSAHGVLQATRARGGVSAAPPEAKHIILQHNEAGGAP
jgi:hypothetical protein